MKLGYCRPCSCSTVAAQIGHAEGCPYAEDARIWRLRRAYVVAGFGDLAGETTATIERDGGGVIAYVVDDEYLSAVTERTPAWWGDRPGAPTVLGVNGFLDVSYSKFEDAAFVIGVGEPGLRRKFATRLDRCRPGIVEDPAAIVMPGALVGVGSVVSAGAVLSHGVDLGEHVFVNYNVTLGHGVGLGDYTVVCPGAQLMGNVEVAEDVFIGTGAIVIPGRKIGRGAVIGAGAVVAKDVEADTTVVGNPARPLGRRE